MLGPQLIAESLDNIGEHLRRILCEWRGLRLYAYSLALYLGILLGVLSGTYAATLRGGNATRVCVAMLLLVPVALVGARLLFVLSHWRVYRRQPSRIWRQSEGGAALYGGLLLSLPFSLLLPKIFRISLGAFWDAETVTMLTGMTFVKIGCLLNGCCAGRPAAGRLAMYLPDLRGVWCLRVPTQLLEAGLAATLLGGSLALRNHFSFDGALFLSVLAAYSAGRWWFEPTKNVIDTIRNISIHRAISAILFAISITVFALMWSHGS
jgi:phosphatidylglycerol:prolipoprotein diacylglycerol transferase